MAAIASINAGIGVFAAAETALSASDTITFDAGRKQLLTLRNTKGVVSLTGGTGVSARVINL